MKKLVFLFGAMAVGGCATSYSAPSWRPSEARIAKPDESHDNEIPAPVMVAARDPQPVARSASFDEAPPVAADAEPAPSSRRAAAHRPARKRHR